MRLKGELESELHTPVAVKAGGLGSLKVLVDGEEIFSNRKAGRLPEPGELVEAIRGRG